VKGLELLTWCGVGLSAFTVICGALAVFVPELESTGGAMIWGGFGGLFVTWLAWGISGGANE
jgi:hypothetical protein